MPIKRFWFYNKMVDRLRAEEDLRLLKVMAAVNSGEAYKQTVETLEKSMGQIYVVTPAERTMSVTTPAIVEVDPDVMDPEFNPEAFRAFRAKYETGPT